MSGATRCSGELELSALARGRARALAALCATQVISWGVLYYAFPVALRAITADTGWSASAASAAFSTGLLTSAVAGVWAGRWLERCGPRRVMTAGSVLAAPAVACIALAPSLRWFTAAWLVAGVAMAGVLYPPAFAAITGWYGPARMRALTILTLVAGLSSTLFAPLTHALLEHLSWRATYLVLAGLLAATTIPLHALALRLPWSAEHHSSAMPGRRHVSAVVGSRAFVGLSASLTVLAFGFYVTSLGLIALLVERGLSAGLAATTLGLLGAGQLLGRLAYAPMAGRLSPTVQLVSVVVVAAGAMTGLALLPAAAALLVAAAVVLGAVRGASTLLQASIVADRWGTTSYATLSGIFSAPITAATAVAPWAAAAIADAAGSYRASFLILAVVTTTAAVIAVSARERQASIKVSVEETDPADA